MENEMNIKEFLNKQNREIKKIQEKEYKFYFDAITTGKEEFYREYEKSAMEMEDFFHNKENFEKIKGFLKKSIEDSIIKRQLNLLYESYLGSQGDIVLLKKILEKSTKVEKSFNFFRAEINGEKLTDNQIKDILKEEQNSEKLKQTWEASKKQGEFVAKEVLEIIKLRNELAQSLGYENYFNMSLELNEQKEEEIDKIFLDLEEKTNKPFEEIKKEIGEVLSKRYKIKISELKPWHYHDLFFQEAPEIYEIDLDEFYKEDVIEKAIKFYEGLGFDVEDILDQSDLYEKPGKYQHACCINIDNSGDVRIVQNTKNNEKWMDTTLHELGHGIYDKNVDSTLPFLLRSHAHTFVTESIALLFGRNSKNSNFIKRFCDVDEEKAEKVSELGKKQLKIREIVFSRWCQVMYYFEKGLYKNPEQDLNKLWWNLVKKYQRIDFSRDKPDWASKIHIVGAPVYYHNYMLGELLASQLQSYIVKNILKQNDVKNPDYNKKEVGEFLRKNLFEYGKKYRWEELIKKTTGEELTTKYFIEEFCD
ncbi:M2 family metallopeptidase [Candidatus Pacearchaeota archaeon]|nr:M2 family metallopeptidase [Candidatus Pacearchaeota archaeon]